MENLFSIGAPHIHFFPSSATIVLVVWSAYVTCNSKLCLLTLNTFGRWVSSQHKLVATS